MRLFLGTWKTAVLPIAAGLVLLAQPGEFLTVKARSTPVGVLAVDGKLPVVRLGTLAALTKSKMETVRTSAGWQPSNQLNPINAMNRNYRRRNRCKRLVRAAIQV